MEQEFDEDEQYEQYDQEPQDEEKKELSVETITTLQGAYEYYLPSEDTPGLDKKGVTDVLFYMKHNPTPLNLKEFWESKGKEEDDLLTCDELIEFYKTMPDDPDKELWRAFKHFDKNGDGTLDKEELKTVLRHFGEDEEDLTEEYIDSVLEQADTNSDGKLNIEEFCKMIIEGAV